MRAQLLQAESQLKRANVDLQDGEIRAPYPGVVSAKHTEVGAYLNVGSPVVTLINDLDIEIEADIPGNRLGGLAKGTTLRLTLEDGSERLKDKINSLLHRMAGEKSLGRVVPPASAFLAQPDQMF